MQALIESLECRRLMSVRTEGVIVDHLPVDTAPVIKKGTLAIYGTAGDDNISVHIVPPGRDAIMKVRVRVVSGETVDGKLNGSVTQSVLVPLGAFSSIVVIGDGGNDQLDTDVTAYKFTKSVDVDSRLLSAIKSSGRKAYVEDPMSKGTAGVLAGSTAKWAKESYSDIQRLRRKAFFSDVLFLGNSHINYLPQIGAEVFKEKFGAIPSLNLGLPGDTTSQLLYRIQQQNMLFFAGNVKVVVVEIGSNNVALSDDVAAITHGIEAVVTELRARLPHTTILLNSILPRISNAENKVVNKVNDRLAALYPPAFSKDKRGIKPVQFVNLTPYFSSQRAKERYYRPNNIHLNSNGYRVWVNQITPVIEWIRNYRME